MPLVRKINVIGKLIDSNPPDGLLPLPILGHFVDLTILLLDDAVTLITGGDGGNPCHRGTGSIGMAVEASDLVVARMDAVAEFNRLNRRGAPARHWCASADYGNCSN